MVIMRIETGALIFDLLSEAVKRTDPAAGARMRALQTNLPCPWVLS
jgi:hypothetical protein